jgi:dTDP-glucose pyrophosphorylase/CBS domain-containing protein
LNKYIISRSNNIREAIKKIDDNGEGLIFIVDEENKVIGVLTDGDFRRAILNGISLSEVCDHIANHDFKYIDSEYFSEREVINFFLQYKIDHLPLLENGLLIRLFKRKDYNLVGKVILPTALNAVSVVIMAGGKGTRMKPFTNIFPKPLIPIGNKSMLEVIMDEYNVYFQSSFVLSVNFKANLIKAYLEEFTKQYNFTYLEEEIPLGTGGALKYLDGMLDKAFFVSNCDILIKANYSDIYKSHIKDQNDVTIVASMIHYKVPYGVCQIENGGSLIKLLEKPEYDFLVNAGMYVLNPEILKYIPRNTFYNITDLIDEVIKNGGKVGVYPVSEKSYFDTGQWKEYATMLDAVEKKIQ